MTDQDRDRAALLFANETFYKAFADKDVTLMSAVWADEEPITCLHPGWPPIEGREPVLQSWHAILTSPNSPQMECSGARAGIHGDIGIVICYEHVGTEYLIATNIFARCGAGWRLIHHHSGSAPEPAEQDTTPRHRMN